jgi:hypothetical protein
MQEPEPEKKPLLVSLHGKRISIEIEKTGLVSDIIANLKNEMDLAEDVNVRLIASGKSLSPSDPYDISTYNFATMHAIITRDWLIRPTGTLLSKDQSFSITYGPSHQIRDLKDLIRKKITDEKLTDVQSYTIKIIRIGGNILQDLEQAPLHFPLSYYTVELDKIQKTGTASSLETQSSTATSSSTQSPLLLKTWRTKPIDRGNLFPGLTLNLAMKTENDYVVQNLKQKIRSLLGPHKPDYVIDITKNGAGLNDSDEIPAGEPLTLYGIEIKEAPPVPQKQPTSWLPNWISIKKACSNWWNK